MTGTESWSSDRVAALLAGQLDADRLPYAFGGALALAAWGVPRATIDVDVSVFVAPTQVERVFNVLERVGALFERREATRDVNELGMFIATLRGVRLDVFLAHHPMHASMEARRLGMAAFEGAEQYFLSAEDVVLTKLIYCRPKDVIDLERLFAVQEARLDVAYVRGWLEQIVGPDDERHEVLRDLERRFVLADS